jgi:hypothetical protein
MTPKERAERLIWLAQQNPSASLQDLSFACSRSQKWTARVLREAGITFPEAPRTQKPVSRNRNATPCRCCNHPRDAHCKGVKTCDHWNSWRWARDHDRPGFLKKVHIPELKARVFIGGTHCTVCDCNRYHGAEKANLRTPCANPECDHPKADHCWTRSKRKGGSGPRNPHFTPEGNWYTCLTNHCTVSHYRDRRHLPCECMEYRDPFAKPGKRKKKTIPVVTQLTLEPQPEQEGGEN